MKKLFAALILSVCMATSAWGAWGTGWGWFGTLTDGKYCTYSSESGQIDCTSEGGSMTYPGAGIPNSTGSAWGTSFTLDADLSDVSLNDDTIPSAKATKAALDGKATANVAPTELTLTDPGAITATQNLHTVDSYGDAATDTLATITAGTDGQLLRIRQAAAERVITIAESGNIVIPNGTTITMYNAATTTYLWVELQYDAGLSKWVVTNTLPDSLALGAITLDAATGIQIGATGVLITSDDDGAITFLGKSAGYDEDITLNLDDVENTVGVSSTTGVTGINLGSLNLATTGTIGGAIPITNDADGMSQAEMTAAGMYGRMYFATGAGTFLLPAVAVGMNICVYSTTAAAVVLDPDNDDGIRNGTADRNADGHKITSDSAAGSFVCVIGDSADGWTVLGKSGTWTDE